MWLMTNKAFLSVVKDRGNNERVLVRARVAGHIESVFPDADVFTDGNADYMFRAFLPRAQVMAALGNLVFDIDYDNFKNSVKNKRLHDAYLQVWYAMWDLQPADVPKEVTAKKAPKKLQSIAKNA